jgi:nucleoside 2-deoxyribosyltransferase
MTNGRLIYFAGSIRGGREDQQLYLEIVDRLKRYGTVLTEHVGDHALTGDGEKLNSREIHDRDLAWLSKAECVVAEVTMPSLGVGYEIGRALEWKKPVLCLFRPVEGRLLSAMIAGNTEVTLREYVTIAELKTHLDNFFGSL